MPGLFVVYCLEHACIIGFDLMTFAESERTHLSFVIDPLEGYAEVIFLRQWLQC